MFGAVTRYIEDETVQMEISRESDLSVSFMNPDGLAYLLYTSGNLFVLSICFQVDSIC